MRTPSLFLDMNTLQLVKKPARRSRKAPTAVLSERGRNVAATNKAYKLAAQHGITIEREEAGVWWITCDKFTEGADPLEGNHFAENGQEVLQAVEVYVAELTKS